MSVEDFTANRYVPGISSAQAAQAAAQAPPATTLAASGGFISDPTVWLIAVLALWAGIAHFGLDMSVSAGG